MTYKTIQYGLPKIWKMWKC